MDLRLKTALWVHAFLRSCMVNGNFGAIVQKGAEDAGVVQLVINRLDGNYDLLSPPPGPTYNDDGERCFVHEINAPRDWPSMNELLQRRRKRDPDLWVVEVELREGFAGLVLVGE
jgi:hypothetical protein